MSPFDHLRWLLTPAQDRWQPMLMGLAVFAAAGGAAVALQPPKLIEAVLVVLALAAWLAGACAMIGYVRWFFASEFSRARQENFDVPEKKDKPDDP